MSSLYETKQAGDILRLPMDIERLDAPILAGGYVLLSVGDVCCVAGLVEDAQGRFCTSSLMLYVPLSDLCYFQATGMRVDPVG